MIVTGNLYRTIPSRGPVPEREPIRLLCDDCGGGFDDMGFPAVAGHCWWPDSMAGRGFRCEDCGRVIA